MAKNKSFSFNNPVVENEAKPVESLAPTSTNKPQAVEEPKNLATVSMPEPSPMPTTSGTTFSMQPNDKKKRGKSVNFLLNEDDYKAFSKITKKLGYSNNEIINRLVSEFIKSNK